MGLDNKKVRNVNIKFPLERSSRGAFATNDNTIDAVADDIKILLLTNHGERPGNYLFGANLRPLIFEQGEDLQQKISDSILIALERWMPFVSVEEIQVFDSNTDLSVDPNEIKVNIKFKVGSVSDMTRDVAVSIRGR